MTIDAEREPRLELISASAGTGKTQALTELVWRACAPDVVVQSRLRHPCDVMPVRPEGLVGVTFTDKAAAELADRIRRRLFLEGSADAAQRLPLAYLGTVHAVGLRLIRDYAFEAGVSPDPRVLPDEGDRFARALLERAIPRERERLLSSLGRRLRVRWDYRTGRFDWQKDVIELVRRARANRISHTELPAMGARAWRELRQHLPDPIAGRDFKGKLLREIATVLSLGPARGDTTEDTRAAFEALHAARKLIGVDGVWAHWCKLARLKIGAKSLALVAGVMTAADMHRYDPRFHADLEDYLREIYAAAADASDAYATWKDSRQTIDWTDMLAAALQVLDVPAVADDIRERIDLVVVDELQDSGPLQVALFARLHEIVGRSTWVGDPKQCVFEWNGADPGLIDGLLAQVPAEHTRRLSVNYRSRPGLVQLVSEVFAAAFASHGLPPEAVIAEPSAARLAVEATLAALPPLGLAWIDKGTPKVPRPSEAVQLARVVAGLLAAPDATRVLDRVTGAVRSLVPGDVAVLVHSNKRCQALAQALRDRGMRVAVALPGVLATAEGRAVQAGLRLLIARDPVAEAELEMLDGCSAFAQEGDSPEVARSRWLAQRIHDEDSEGRWSVALGPVRAQLLALSPAGVVERVIEVLDLVRRVREWGPGGAERVANLDAIRALARTCEAELAVRAQGATLSGLMRFLAGRADQGEQHVPESEAGLVTVVTYHKAKGLEWPVVVLGQLGHDKPRSAFDVWVESDVEPSLARPLEGRWVRYWPWPYGDMKSGRLKDTVMAGATGRLVSERERREQVRLLYVGFTRARDHLILAIPRNAKGESAAKWLGCLGADRVVFDYGSGARGAMRVHGLTRFEVPCRLSLQSDATFVVREDHMFARAESRADEGQRKAAPDRERPLRRVAPSRVTAAEASELGGATLVAGEVVALGADGQEALWLGASGGTADLAGLALHAFLAGDSGVREPDERRAAALGWLAAYAVEASAVDGVLVAADAFWSWLRERWGAARVVAEVPIHARVRHGERGERVIQGSVDLLIETEAGVVLIDHKSGHRSRRDGEETGEERARRLRDKVLGYAPQLATYRVALEAAGHRVAGIWVHLAGAAVAIELV